MESKKSRSYYRAALRLLAGVLVVWFGLSFGCSILLREWLDTYAPAVGNAPFGFWMAQQGAIIGFVILLVIYAWRMNRLEERFRTDKEEE
jgi:putative solute:sodium symporter small subunit